MTPATRARVTDVAVAIGYAVLTLAFFWKIALTNRVLAGVDVFAYFYPYRDAVSQALKAGQLPLWNPYLFMGAPLLANSQAAVLYPLHWPLLWLSPPKQVAWSIVVHIWLAGVGTYLLARRPLRLPPLAAFASGAIFAFGGFLGAQVEHLNQLNTSVWLPWLLLCLETAWSSARLRFAALLAGSGVVALMLLAGHTQATYIVLAGAAAYAALRGLYAPERQEGRQRLRGLLHLVPLAAMVLMGILLSAGQLLPTVELAGLSVRSGGLAYREAASFSLRPGLIIKALLPPIAWETPFSEFVAYVGLLGLALAGLGAWATLRRPQPHPTPGSGSQPTRAIGVPALGLAFLGIFLALGAYNPVYYLLYKFVPGVDLFRAPARWLLLYAFGAALLAGLGLRSVPLARPWKAALAVLIVCGLFVFGRNLAYDHPTAPSAFESMRTAPAHLLAAGPGEPSRFLSMSDITYDPGDLEDLQTAYGPYLTADEFYDLVVATKMKEVLAFNLPLRYRLFSVDGYDGGLLPTAWYVTLEQLFLKPEEIWSDGRLRQQLRAIPPARLLSLLNVRYVITDKMQDLWLDGIYYDLEHTVPLGQVSLVGLPSFEATSLGIVSYLTQAAELPDGTPVAQVSVTDTGGLVLTGTLRAGVDTAEGLYSSAPVRHSQARVAHQWRDSSQGTDYATVLDLGQAIQPVSIEVTFTLPVTGGATFALRGLTLIDARTGTSRSVSVDPNYRLVHSGDVKVYENLSVLPRAFVVHQAEVCADDEQALALLRQPSFDPSRQVILAEGTALAGGGGPAQVQMIAYGPEQAEWRVSLDSPGYLVVSDSFYPGWEARVDGEPAPILRADIYFRAVALDAGQHNVVFSFKPSRVRVGMFLGTAAWLAWGLAAAMAAIRVGRNRPSRV